MPASRPSSAPSIPRRSWIGIDLDQTPPVAAVAWRTWTGIRVRPLAADAVRALRPDGARCATALAMDRIFCEHLEPPTRNRAQAERLAPGLLDLRLPLPVERCAVTWIAPPGRAATANLLAFAVPHDALDLHLETQRRTAVDAERVVPAAHALWHRLGRAAPPPTGVIQLLLHASTSRWTLLIGRGPSLQSCLTLPPGDLPSLGRHLQVFTNRWRLTASRLLLCGPGADAPLQATLRALPPFAETDISLADAAASYLATALAEEAADAGGHPDGNLRHGPQDHPAIDRRAARRQQAHAAMLLLAGLVLLTGQLFLNGQSRHALRQVDDALTRSGERLAGRRLPFPGAAAIELARREMEERLSPDVEAFGDEPPLSLLPRLLAAAAIRNITFSTVHLDDRRMELAGEADSEADFAAWRQTVASTPLAPALEPEALPGGRMRFSGKLILREALP